jgi:hypothetical protein
MEVGRSSEEGPEKEGWRKLCIVAAAWCECWPCLKREELTFNEEIPAKRE